MAGLNSGHELLVQSGTIPQLLTLALHPAAKTRTPALRRVGGEVEAMFSRTMSAIAVSISVLAGGPAMGQQKSLEREGEAILSKNCSMCHAVGRTGASPHRQAPPFRTLSRRYPVAELEEALGEGLSSGHPDMPDFVFPPQQINGIIAYLKSVQER